MLKINGVEIESASWYSPEDTARVLGQKESYLATLRCRKEGLPYSKFGRMIAYRGADIIAALERGRVETSGVSRRTAA